MYYEDYLQAALVRIDAWQLPEAEFAQALNDQVRIIAGKDIEPSDELPHYSPYASLRF